jgi:uncharacterized protein (DUF362 family)/Pyruvate/2-oxoacid:ferredoxin oxidoreductase delta subunit
VLVGDSPGLGSAAKVAAACGITEALADLDAEIIEFTADTGSTSTIAPGLGSLDMAAELRDIDVLINLPKFKSHGMTGLTLGVKNCFGLVVGARKLQWHFRAGHNAELFSRMLNEVHDAATPALTILDAVVGMEGEGPTAGRPRDLGFLAASSSAHSLDAFAASLVVDDIRTIPTLAEHMKREEDGDWKAPIVIGPGRDELAVENFELPPPRTHFHMGPLRWFGFLRRLITAKPVVKRGECKSCGKCAQICPARAIEMVEGLPVIEDKPCIRCYCCHELCPYSAMTLKTTWLGRWIVGRRG